MYYLTFQPIYRDLEHGEFGFRVKTSYDTYTVMISPRGIIVHPRNGELESLEMVEPYTSIISTPAVVATLAVFTIEQELYGELA